MASGPKPKRARWVAVLGLLAPWLVSVLPRLPALFAARASRPFDKYLWASDQLAGGADLGARMLDYSPLYLQIHVLARHLTADPAALLLGVHFALGVGASLLIYVAGRRVGGVATGLVAAALYSLHATVLAYEVTLEPEAVSLFCLAAVVALAAAGTGRLSALLMGLAFGLALSNRPNAALLAPFLLVALLVGPSPASGPARRWPRVALLGAGALIGLVPMISAIRASSGGFFESMSSGQVFHQGTSTEAKGLGVEYPALFHEMPDTFSRGGDYAHETYRLLAAADLGHSVTPAESDDLWRARAGRFVREYPRQYVRLLVRKLLLLVSGVEVHDVGETASLLDTLRPKPPLAFGWLAALGLAGAALCLGEPRRHVVPFGILTVYTVSALILFVSSRQRLPMTIPLALLAARGLVLVLQGGDRRMLRAGGFVAVALLVLLLPNLERSTRAGYEASFRARRASEAWYETASVAYRDGRIDAYRSQILRAGALSPPLLQVAPSIPTEAMVAARDSVGGWYDRSIPEVAGPERAFLSGFFLLETGDAAQALAPLGGLQNHGWFRQSAAELHARAAIQLGRTDEALAALDAVDPPSLPGGALRLAILERTADARLAEERARLEDFHGSTAVLYFTGLAHLRVGNAAAADRDLAQFLARVPDIPRAILGRAEAHRALGDAAGAVALFEAARRLQPGAFSRPAEISTAYRALLAESPADRALATRLGEILRHEGKGAESRDVLAPVVRAAPGDFDARGQLVRTLVEMGLPREAQIAARPPIGVQPGR